MSLGSLAEITGKEAIRAFLPLSLAVVAGTFCKQTARWAWVTALATVFHVVAHAWSASPFDIEGALLLPLAIPATLVAARMLPTRWQIVVAVVGGVLSLLKLGAHHPSDAAAFARGAHALGATSATTWLVSADGADHAACVAWLPRSEHVRVADVYVRADAIAAAALVRTHVDRMHAGGRRVYLTFEAERELRRPHVRQRFPAAIAVLAVLQREFTLAQVEADGLRAKEVRPRGGR